MTTRSNDLNREERLNHERQPPNQTRTTAATRRRQSTESGGGAGLTADGDVLGVGIGDGRRDLLDVERALALHVQAGTERHDDHLAATHRPPAQISGRESTTNSGTREAEGSEGGKRVWAAHKPTSAH